jgi:hypothetical protein
MCPHIFVNFYMQKDDKTKTCECNLFIYIFSSMQSRYRVHGALKNAKAENIFMIFSNAGIGK